jgi:hypothetical protein
VKSKTRIKREVTKIRVEINAIEPKKTILRINETKCFFFEKINKMVSP